MEFKNKNNLEGLKTLSGIDTLYYYAVSNEKYDDFYLNLIDEMDTIRQRLSNSNLKVKNSDIVVNIGGVDFIYTGQPEGFHHFMDVNRYVYIAFKDKFTQLSQNDIKIKLQAIGIYNIGIKPLIEYANSILKDITTGDFPVTRVDLNTFIQYDFKFIRPDMFVSRKRWYDNILRDKGNRLGSETIYVGLPPFRLRFYDKRNEVIKPKKLELMTEYFLNNDFSLDEPIWNAEFEMHREHLKTYKLNTIDDVLANAEQLFKSSCDAIRLCDMSTVTQKDIDSGHRNRAKTLPVWEAIRDNYSIGAFLQITAPLERIKRISYIFTQDKAIEMLSDTIRVIELHGVNVCPMLIKHAKDKIELDAKRAKVHEIVIDSNESIDESEKLKLGGVKKLTSYELDRYLKEIKADLARDKPRIKDSLTKCRVAHAEMVKRRMLFVDTDIVPV
jgi:hypothetical protein